MSNAPSFQTWEQAVDWLRSQPNQLPLVMAAYYDDPLLTAADRYWQSPEWVALRAFLHKTNGSALDIGAGRGIASYALARQGFRVTALEPDGSAIVGAAAIRTLASEANLPIEVVQEYSERLPFEDQTFDIVFARAVLHHTKDLQAACREVFRVLKPGGQFIAVREHVISRTEDLPAFLEAHPLHRYYGGENAFLLSQYEAAIDKAGFQSRQTLAPLETVINFSPQSLESLQLQIARRLSLGVPGLGTIMHGVLRLPGVWQLARRAVSHLDHRPGRLYSFVAARP